MRLIAASQNVLETALFYEQSVVAIEQRRKMWRHRHNVERPRTADVNTLKT